MASLTSDLAYALAFSLLFRVLYHPIFGFLVFPALPNDDDPYGGCLAMIFRYTTCAHIFMMLFWNWELALSPPVRVDRVSYNFNVHMCLDYLVRTLFIELPIRVGLLGLATFVLA